MSRYEEMLAILQEKNSIAFVPFLMLMDPTPEIFLQIVDTVVKNGADALELGLPFSDPIADGPVIQKASIRALKIDKSLHTPFKLLNIVRERYPKLPIGLLTYANIVYKNGLNNFYSLCRRSKIDSVLIADLSRYEAKPYCMAAIKHEVDPILICPPNAHKDYFAFLKEYGRGITYVLARQGVTGEDKEPMLNKIKNIIISLHDASAPPPMLGFGISTPTHVKMAKEIGAKGVFVGSKITSVIEQHLNSDYLYEELASFCQSFKAEC